MNKGEISVSRLSEITSGIVKFSLRGNGKRLNCRSNIFLNLLNGCITSVPKIIGTLKCGIKRQYMGKITLNRKKEQF